MIKEAARANREGKHDAAFFKKFDYKKPPVSDSPPPNQVACEIFLQNVKDSIYSSFM